MNCSVYIFGNLQRGFTQYPDDYTRGIFQRFHEKATAKSQIITYRSGSLMYYGYIRNLDKTSQYIGFCFLLNGVMLPKPQELFSVFENAVERLVVKGEILGFSDSGEKLVPLVDSLSDVQNEVEKTVVFIRNELSEMEKSLTKLPPPNYRVAIDASKVFSAGDADDVIQDSIAEGGYTCILKEKDFDTASMTSYRGVIQKLNKDKETLRLNKDKKISKLQQEKAELSKELTKAKARQQNVTWVAVLGIVVIVLGIVLWNKVLFPSEGTCKEMGEFVYYGPLKGGKPNGVGVAIYPDSDSLGRKFYYGNFENGERQDEAAVLFWQDGDYFYGSMSGDKFENGVEYINSDNSYFRGTFVDNAPYDGEWYDFVRKYSLRDGVRR